MTDAIDILLVDPNPGDTRLFTEHFREAKFMNTIHTVMDGESALEFVNQQGEYSDVPRPDIILLDPQLPGMSGLDVVSTLHDEPALSDIPVVMLTSSDSGEAIVKSHDVDVDTYIRKPVEPEDFISFVQSIEDFWLAIVQQQTDE